MSNIALFIYGINDLKGGGGAERFFADFFDEYQDSKASQNKLFYIIDKKSIKNLKEVNKLKNKNNLLSFKTHSNRLKHKLETLELAKHIFLNNIKIIHIPLYDPTYIPILKKLNGLPKVIRPKIVVNVVNCYVAQVLSDKNHNKHQSICNSYLPLFKDVDVSGYFCWNESFVNYVEKEIVFNTQPKKLYAIKSRFSDVKKFIPSAEKQNLVVFASRLDEQKHADWYLKAIEIIKSQNKLNGWKFILCGNGPLREELIKQAAEKKLSDVLDFRIEGRMEKLFNISKIYVSCQDYDNFPSLSMSEAMASGNAIVARNVGQTNLFVTNNKNGVLINPDSAEGLADALIKLIADDKMVKKMGEESTELIKTVHNVPNFIRQIDNFWNEILNNN